MTEGVRNRGEWAPSVEYYINDIVDSNNFTISNALVNVTVTATNSYGTSPSSTASNSVTPLVFVGAYATLISSFAGTKIYVDIVNGSDTTNNGLSSATPFAPNAPPIAISCSVNPGLGGGGAPSFAISYSS